MSLQSVGRGQVEIGGFLIRASCLAAESEWIPKAVSAAYPFVQRLAGKSFADRFVRYVVGCLGYLLHRKGLKNNLHCLSLQIRIEHGLNSKGMVKKRPVSEMAHRLRIGFVGEMAAEVIRPPSLVSRFPGGHDLYVYDLAWEGNFGMLPDVDNVKVRQYDLAVDYDVGVKEMAADINNDCLDFLIVSNYFAQVKNDLLDGVDTPCLVNFSMGSHISFHPKVDYSLYAQPRKNFHIRNNRLYSEFTGRPMRGELCYPETHVFHDREISRADNPKWEDRKTQMCFHGRLAQLNSPVFLGCLADILETDPSIRFSFVGEGKELDSILGFFNRRNLSDQVEYLGQVDRVCGNEDKWMEIILPMLRRSRLAPNPWPRGGGSSRVEAYAAGVPTVHLGMVVDGQNQFDTLRQTVVDVPSLAVESATVYGIEEYKSHCLKCLFDKTHAERVVEDQYARVKLVTDHGAWWNEVIGIYEKWHGNDKSPQC